MLGFFALCGISFAFALRNLEAAPVATAKSVILHPIF